MPSHFQNQCKIIVNWTFGKNFIEILKQNTTFFWSKLSLKMSSPKRQPFCLSLHVLSQWLPYKAQYIAIYINFQDAQQLAEWRQGMVCPLQVRSLMWILYSSLFYYIQSILPKGPYLPCLRMADRALLAGYPQYILSCYTGPCNNRNRQYHALYLVTLILESYSQNGTHFTLGQAMASHTQVTGVIPARRYIWQAL